MLPSANSAAAELANPAYVSIRQHTPAYARIHQHMSAYVRIHTCGNSNSGARQARHQHGGRPKWQRGVWVHPDYSLFLECKAAYICDIIVLLLSKRYAELTCLLGAPRESARRYVSIRQHTSACGSIRPACLEPHASQQTSAYASMRQHTSAYGSIRELTAAYGSIRQHT